MENQWENISKQELEHLFYEKGLTDSQIANIFGVNTGKVTYRRKNTVLL